MRWSNVPIPEAHVAALIGGVVLEAVLPVRIPLPHTARRLIAAPMLASGAALTAWAVASAGDTDVDADSALVTSGAYSLSRNPMYLGWSAAILGAALASGSAWLLTGWLLAVRSLDREIDAEELRLLHRFGSTYATYRDRVPRYLAFARRLGWPHSRSC
jgi:protein-S-isoprenylcysteine O-methyltransferase Ste14